MQLLILHFCLRKEVKKIFYAGFSTESELCIPSEDYDIDSPSCCHKNHFYQATIFRNIMNDLHSLNIRCSTVADKMKLLRCHGIHLTTKIIHFLGQEVFVCQICIKLSMS